MNTKNIKKIREKLEFYLNDSETAVGKVIDLSLLSVNLLACVLFATTTYIEYQCLNNLEYIIVVIFAVEYLLRIFCTKNTLKYIFSCYGIIDLLSILPSIIPVGELVFLRGLKVLRVLRFTRYLETQEFFFGKLSRIQLQATRTVFSVLTIIYVASGCFLYAELQAPVSKIHNFGDAFYFSVTTLSTVGFGDIVPVTSEGRFVTVIMILSGAILIPWQAGKLVRLLINKDSKKKNITCETCGLIGHDADASHCKACGSVIYQEYSSEET